MSLAQRAPSWLSGGGARPSRSPSPGHRSTRHRTVRLPDSPPPPRRRRRHHRRPSLWDVREPQYGIPMPPPGATPAAAAGGGIRGLGRNDANNVSGGGGKGMGNTITGWTDTIVGNSGLDGIDIEGLKKLLNPKGDDITKNGVEGLGNVSIGALVGMLGGNTGGSNDGSGVGGGVKGGLSPNVGTGMRQARRLYVGNLPADATEADVASFFNDAMVRSNGAEAPGSPIVSVYLNLEKRFAFIELRSLSEAAAALSMDGLLFRGMSLRMRRPNDYDERWGIGVTPPAGFNPGILGIVSTQVGNGPNKVFIGGIPYHLNEDNIKELLRTYGELRAFNLIKDPNTGQSKGFAFFEYTDPAVIEPACAGLNGMLIGDKTLTVRKAGPAGGSAATGTGGGLLDAGGDNANRADASTLLQQCTKVVELKNLVSKEDLDDEEEMKEIREDVENEAKTFGHLLECFIPGKEEAGAGKVWLKYEDEEAAEKAVATLNGRKFAGRTVEARYFNEDKFEKRELVG